MKNRVFKIITSVLIFLIYYFSTDIINYLLDIFRVDFDLLNRPILIFILFMYELIPLLVLIIIYKDDLKNKFKSFKDNFVDNMDKYIRLWLLAIVLMSICDILIGLFTGSEISNNEQAIRNIANVLPIYMIFSSAICAPIVEEIAYRKIIRDIFSNKYLSIIMSGLLFGLAHVLGTYTELKDLLYIFSYGVFGAIFMYIYIDSDNIWNTIFLHFLHNTILLTIYFIR